MVKKNLWLFKTYIKTKPLKLEIKMMEEMQNFLINDKTSEI